MLKINQTFSKLFFLIAISFLLLLMASYFSLKLLIVDSENLEIYNQIWMILIALSIFILILIYFYIESIRYKFTEDIEHFQGYINEISNKNYQAVIKIKYFREFLEMSLRLKNIVKRLNNKDTKKK